MIYSLDLSKTLIKHIYRNNRKKNKYIPFVLMLEPLFKCNLACSGCGRIREYKDVLDRKLTGEECIEAAMQAGAPIVSITGGEPLLHPEMKQIIRSLLTSGYFVYLCTNGLLLEDFLDEIAPLDFGSPDITGHVLYVMGELGYLDPAYKKIIDKALAYLMKSQRDDGSWSEDYYTGGGFPGTFYLGYELYKDYFPLMALGKYGSDK